MAVLSTINGYGTHAARPAAGTAGATYFETDTGLLFRDSGSAWQSINLASLATTKGDLLVATASGVVTRLGAGADGLPLVADSSQASGLNYGGVVGGTAFAPSGLTGSVAASRYVGATASVAPTTGAHLLGDWVTTQDGKVFTCTTAGTPGTWTQVSGSGTFTGEVAGTDFAPTGLTGSTAASRYVGATASGAPASGAHLLGDFVIEQTGKVYVCTVAGTPGTWTQAGGSGALTQVAQTILGGAAASIVFSSIAGTYSTLFVTYALRSDNAGTGNTGLWVRLNADTGAHYDFNGGFSGASGWSSGATAGDTKIALAFLPNNGNTAGMIGSGHFHVHDYVRTTFWRSVVGQGGLGDGTTQYNTLCAGRWRDTTSAVSTVTLLPSSGNFLTGSVATIYGVS